MNNIKLDSAAMNNMCLVLHGECNKGPAITNSINKLIIHNMLW